MSRPAAATIRPTVAILPRLAAVPPSPSLIGSTLTPMALLKRRKPRQPNEKAPHLRGFPLADHKRDSVWGSHPSGPDVTVRLVPPTWSSAGRVIAPLGVAPGGACLAVPVSGDAGGLLHHRFTLAAAFTCDVAAVCSLLRFPAGFPVRGLPGTLALWCPDFPRRRSAAAA